MKTTLPLTPNWITRLKKVCFVILPFVFALGLLAYQISIVKSAAGLTVEILAGHNLVVDSNVKSPSTFGPSVATVAGRFCNPATNAHTLRNVTGYIGDYTGVTNTPGLYPSVDMNSPAYSAEHPLLAGSGNYSFTHLGSLADATRYIGDLAPGECKVQYWSFTYPRCESNVSPPCGQDAVWGDSADLKDDLDLAFDIWGAGTDASNTSTIIAATSHTMTMRSEISAMANKIEPNPDGAWFNTDTSVVYPGDIITTNGVNYTFGNVNAGFDNNGDGMYDNNAWMQPFGTPSYDPGCFRLVRTTGTLTVTRSGGNPPLIFSFRDQLYFDNLPADNTNVTGRVYYTFLALGGACQAGMTPYQEAASGTNNEKFNGDFGTATAPLQSFNSQVVVDKTSNPASAPVGSNITYSIPFTNTGSTKVGLTLSSGAAVDMPFTIQDTVPAGLDYVCGSATASFSYSPADYTKLFSVNNGATWTIDNPSNCSGGFAPSTAANPVIIQWRLNAPLPAKTAGTNTSKGVASFQARIPSNYISPDRPLFISNQACANLGGASTNLDCGTATTMVQGGNSIGDAIWRDENLNGIQDTGEAGLNGVTVWLYWDKDNDGVLDADEPKVGETTSALNGSTNGYYSFTGLPTASYLVSIDLLDPEIPTGYNLTTTAIRVVKDQLSGSTSYLLADFGLGPALSVDKSINSVTPVVGGQLISYTIDLMNNLPGDGTVNNFCQYKVWARIDNTNVTNAVPSSGNQLSKQFPPIGNALGEPNGLVSTSYMESNEDTLGLSGFNLGGAAGAVTSVKLQIVVQEVEELRTTDTLELRVYRNDAADTTNVKTFTGANLNRAAGSFYTLESTPLVGTWTLANFTNNLTELQIASSSANNSGAIGVDAVAFVVTTNRSCGGSSTTMVTLPLTDTYNANLLDFVSAVPAPTNVVTNRPGTYNGQITWSNVGPLYAGGKTSVTVYFRAKLPGISTTSINSAASYSGVFGNGRLVNNASDNVTFDMQPGGTINGTVFANTITTDNWVTPTGYGSGDTYIPNVTVELRACVSAKTGIVIPAASIPTNGNPTCTGNPVYGEWRTLATQSTDANGYYSFTGLRTGYYNVRVVSNTLPANLTTCSLEATYPGNGAGGTSCDGSWLNEGSALYTSNFNPIDQTTSAETITNVSFGYRSATSGVISGYVWNDRNANGVWDPGEEPIPYITANACITGTSPCTTLLATTDATGYYEFTPTLPGGATTNYTVVVTPPGGMNQSGDPNVVGACSGASCDNQTSLSLSLSQVAGPFNFGYTGGYSIGDTIYTDWNGNGTQDAGEEGLSGVTVSLYRDLNADGILDPGEPLLSTKVTGSSGDYLFDKLPGNGNDYLVIVSKAGIPAGYTQSGDPNETGVCTVCDAKSPVPNLAVHSLGNDFGFKPTGYGVIGDAIWRDLDGDGVQDSGELGISGVTVNLYQDQNGNGVIDGEDALVRTATTDASGLYCFTGLFPTKYVVQLPASNFNAGQNLNTLVQTNGTGNLRTVTLSANETNNTLDFGYANSALGGTIWSDNNGDGTQGAGEAGIPNVQVTLYHSTDGVNWQVATNQTTGADGAYQFTGLTAGRYRVAVTDSTHLTSYTLTYDPDAYSIDPVSFPPPVCIPSGVNADKFVECNAISTTNLLLGRVDMTHDFGYIGPGSIGDYVWIDSDGDGVQDNGEAGLGGVTVTLTLPGGATRTTTTDSDGYYSFGGLTTAGSYILAVTPPAGMVSTFDGDSTHNGSTTFTLSGGHVSQIGTTPCSTCDLNLDFGFKYNGIYSIQGTVFLDINQSGTVYDPYSTPADMALGNITVYLYDSSSRLVATSMTNTSGGYTFPGLANGSYTVVVSTLSPQLNGMSQTYEPGIKCSDAPGTCNNITTVVINGGPITQRDFGFYARMDCGDLPSTNNLPAGQYHTRLQDEGPCHIGPSSGNPSTYLGSLWDSESDGQPSDKAIGDDTFPSDEDGVTPLNFGTWTSGNTAQLTIQITGDHAYLAAWFDWNNNRRFTSALSGEYDTGEYVYFGALPAGTHTLTVNIPAGTNCCSTNRNLYARFRVFRSLSGLPLVSATGNALDGEIEDYMWGNAPTAVTMGPLGVTVDGNQATLTWLTAMEMNAIGFNVYRSAGPQGGWVKLNTELILSQSAGELGGAFYEWLDPNLPPGVYQYMVEFIDIYGSEYFGPVQAVVGIKTYLPLVGR